MTLRFKFLPYNKLIEIGRKNLFKLCYGMELETADIVQRAPHFGIAEPKSVHESDIVVTR